MKQMLGKITSLDSNNYPEMLGKTCIINAPSGFGMIFGVVKPFLDARTRAKVEVRSVRVAMLTTCMTAFPVSLCATNAKTQTVGCPDGGAASPTQLRFWSFCILPEFE